MQQPGEHLLLGSRPGLGLAHEPTAPQPHDTARAHDSGVACPASSLKMQQLKQAAGGEQLSSGGEPLTHMCSAQVSALGSSVYIFAVPR